jgi:hypothetical protein
MSCIAEHTELLHSNGHGTDPQKTSYLIATSLADWPADCCLEKNNNIRNSIVACVYSVARCLPVRCLAIYVTMWNPQTRPASQSHIATDGQSVSKSWYRAPSGAHDQIFISVWQLRSFFRGALSLTRGRVCLLYVPLALPAQSFSGPSPLRFATVFYCLRFETSPFVASYDSQGHGGSIRPRLHTGCPASVFER